MKWLIFSALLYATLFFGPFPSAELQPLDTPINSYSGGVGMYRFFSNDLLFVPLDYKYTGNTFGISNTLGLISIYEYTVITLDVPVTLKAASLGPVRFNAGVDFTNWVLLDEYFGIHGIGPLFSFTIPVPYNGSTYEVGFSVPFGVITDGDHGEFLVDLKLHNNLQLMFNDRFGVTYNFSFTENINAGGAYFSGPTRIFLYGGPCIRW